ncbi:MAG: Lrp/AsnC family transcriptional regulator [Promethearchaeota archaeon]
MAKGFECNELDKIDRQILEILKEDGRMSFRKVAEMIGKTEATVRRRVKRMQEVDGIIDHFTVIIRNDFEKKIKATLTIDPELNSRKKVVEALLDMDEITDIWLLSRNCGIFCRVEVEDMQAVQDLIDSRLSNISGIQHIEPCFVMKELKSKYHTLKKNID